MLLTFSIENFKSIVTLEVPLSYGESRAPQGHESWSTWPFLHVGKTRAIPLLGMFGANASGKSTIIQAFATCQSLLRHGHSPQLYLPNRLHHDLNITRFQLQICLPKVGKFTYSISYNAQEIIAESLIDDQHHVTLFQNLDGKQLFDALIQKDYDNSKLKGIFQVECCNQKHQQLNSILSRLGQNYPGLNSTVTAAYSTLTKECLILTNNALTPRQGLSMLTAAMGDADAQTRAFTEISTLLRKLDLGIQRMECEACQQEITAIFTYHTDTRGHEIQFSFEDESQGTKAAFGLIGACLATLQTGNILVIDEIDNSLHPLLLIALLKLFKDKSYNTKQAQLIFTAQNTELLEEELLRISEVAIVSKNLKNGSTLHRICDFADIKNTTNFRKQYLQGRFSGIPFPYL